MYKAILLPKLLYVSRLVANGEKAGGKEPAAKPTGRLPKGCSGAMKTTPTEALEVALCRTPLDLVVIEAVGLAA
jgi:hypothetical protein